MKKSSNQNLSAQSPENDTGSSAKTALAEQIAVLKQRIESQKTLTKEAKKKMEMQGQLLATVSHELRTQMGAIMNLVEILAQTNLDRGQRHYAETLENSATGMLRVLNDVLDHAKIESGEFELVSRNFSPRKLVDMVIASQIIPCQNKGLALRLEVANGLPDQLYGDPLRIRQVLSNLVTNAVKFTSIGAIDISISTSRPDGAHEFLEIAVKDTGIGLSEQLKDQLFTPYKQADANVSAQFGGTGLGLSICRKLVLMMEGDINYTSEVGRGTEFRFKVKCKPFQPDASGEPESRQNLHDVLTLDKERTGNILIVEDNKTNQMLISTYLEKFGHTFEIASSGEEALERVQRQKFDAILMDVIMPGMDGMETTRHMRKSRGYTRSIPIIALTANAMSGDRKKYLDAGMDAYVSKPIHAAELFHAIDKALTNAEAVVS